MLYEFTPSLKKTILLSLFPFAFLSQQAISQDDVTHISFATAQAPQTANVSQSLWYMDKIEEKTKGKVKWDKYYASSLLGSRELIKGVSEGRVDSSLFVTGYDPARMPLLDIGYVPITGTNTIGNAYAMRELVKTNDAIKRELDKNGVKILTFVGVSNADTIGTKNLEKDISVFDGSRIRVIGPVTVAISALGASTVNTPAEEVYESMERGLFTGYAGYTVESAVGGGLNEVAPWMHFLPFGNFASSIGLMISKDKWNELDEETQKIFLETQDEYYESLPKLVMEGEKKACDAYIESGGGTYIYDVNDPKIKKWVDDVGDQMIDRWAKTAKARGASVEDIESVKTDFINLARKYSEEAVSSGLYTPGEVLCTERSKIN